MINLFQEAFDFQAALLGQVQSLERDKAGLEAQLVKLVKENSDLSSALNTEIAKVCALDINKKDTGKPNELLKNPI